jgi:hypothetical protein
MKKKIRGLFNFISLIALIGVGYAAYVLSFQMFNAQVSGAGQPNVTLINHVGVPVSVATPTKVDADEAKVIAFEAVNIREGPSEHENDIGDLLSGKVVNVFECQNGWARIGINKWVKAKYLEPACE